MSWLAFWSAIVGIVWLVAMVVLFCAASDAAMEDRWIKFAVLLAIGILLIATTVGFLVGQIG